jgi:hypothetical protein
MLAFSTPTVAAWNETLRYPWVNPCLQNCVNGASSIFANPAYYAGDSSFPYASNILVKVAGTGYTYAFYSRDNCCSALGHSLAQAPIFATICCQNYEKFVAQMFCMTDMLNTNSMYPMTTHVHATNNISTNDTNIITSIINLTYKAPKQTTI